MGAEGDHVAPPSIERVQTRTSFPGESFSWSACTITSVPSCSGGSDRSDRGEGGNGLRRQHSQRAGGNIGRGCFKRRSGGVRWGLRTAVWTMSGWAWPHVWPGWEARSATATGAWESAPKRPETHLRMPAAAGSADAGRAAAVGARWAWRFAMREAIGLVLLGAGQTPAGVTDRVSGGESRQQPVSQGSTI